MDRIAELRPEPDDVILPARFAIRAAWVAVEIVVVLYLGQPGALFFYQLF